MFQILDKVSWVLWGALIMVLALKALHFLFISRRDDSS